MAIHNLVAKAVAMVENGLFFTGGSTRRPSIRTPLVFKVRFHSAGGAVCIVEE